MARDRAECQTSVERAPWSVLDVADNITRGQWRRIREHYGDRARAELDRLARAPSLDALRALTIASTEHDLAVIHGFLTCEQRQLLWTLLAHVLPSSSAKKGPPDADG